MSGENALVPIDQRSVDFYGDPITAVLVRADDPQAKYPAVLAFLEEWRGKMAA